MGGGRPIDTPHFECSRVNSQLYQEIRPYHTLRVVSLQRIGDLEDSLQSYKDLLRWKNKEKNVSSFL